MALMNVTIVDGRILIQEFHTYVDRRGTARTEMYPSQAREIAAQLIKAANQIEEGEDSGRRDETNRKIRIVDEHVCIQQTETAVIYKEDYGTL